MRRSSPSPAREALGLALALVLGALAFPTIAHAADLTADPAHTSANFTVKHLTLTSIDGTIAVKDAEISTAPDGTLTSAKAHLDLTTIDTKFADRDADLKSDHWFDVAAMPTMTFASTKITGTKNDMTILGNLTFHGVTNPVTLVGKYEGSVKDQRGRTHVGYSATGTIDRTKWNLGMSYPEAVVGHDVTITIQMEAIAP